MKSFVIICSRDFAANSTDMVNVRHNNAVAADWLDRSVSRQGYRQPLNSNVKVTALVGIFVWGLNDS
jgi:hypothetical protein